MLRQALMEALEEQIEEGKVLQADYEVTRQGDLLQVKLVGPVHRADRPDGGDGHPGEGGGGPGTQRREPPGPTTKPRSGRAEE